jgi:membrane-anchored protein YejM (alkaline phosphatase superfamily)
VTAPKAPRTNPSAQAWAEDAALCSATLITPCAFWWLAQAPSYAALTGLAASGRTAQEALLIPATVCAQSLLLLLPGLLAALLLRRSGRASWATSVFVPWSSLVFTVEALDLQTYNAFGRHLSEVARFALLPGGAKVGGDVGHWVLVVLRCVALSALGSALSTWLLRRAANAVAERASLAFRRALGLLAVPVLGLSAALPWYAGVFYHHPDLRERLYKQLVWSPGPELANAAFKDPNWAVLDAGLRAEYARAFPHLFAERRLSIERGPARTPPNVIIVLLESWRADSLTPERMPRLSAWAERGLVAEQHYGGSDYSEAGMFSLLYGRTPLLFHATLDRHEPAAWCPLAHTLGMECSYFSGHPKIWMRREEFLNESAVDHFVHDDNGGWNQWDQSALANAVTAVQVHGARPQLALVYLMSTHFEYEYPASYERHLPVRNDMSWRGTDPGGLGAADKIPVSNRYLNSLAFMDDLVADAIAKLDPQQNIVVLTGDHGESLGEDGHFGHGYGFPDSIAKVPFVIVGPGIAPSHRKAPSLHADLLRSLAHALGGQASGPAEAQDLLAEATPRSGLLLAHCSYGRKVADAVLSRGAARVRMELGLQQPEVNLLWPEDSAGHPKSTESLGAEQVKQLLSTFEAELTAIYSPTRSL